MSPTNSNSSSNPNALWAGRTIDGYLVRIEGQGTLRDSSALREFAEQALESQGEETLVVDLSQCEYLDSTFLGCLVWLHKRYGMNSPARFSIAASQAAVQRLLGPNHLDRLLNSVESSPGFQGEAVLLNASNLSANELGGHVMECHRHLADLDGPRKEAFAKVADHLARELSASKPAPGT